MANITNLIDHVLDKYIQKDQPKLKKDISTNLEFRLLFPIDLSKPFKIAKKEFLRHYINDLLTLSLGNISLAAKRAQIHRRHFHRIVNNLDIDTDTHRKELLKPAMYMRSYVYNIIEDTLSDFKNKDVQDLYSNIDDISSILAEGMDFISYDEALDLFEKEYIERLLRQFHYDLTKTSSALDMSERTLYRKIGRLNIAVV